MDTVLLTSAAVGAFVGASAALVIIFMIPPQVLPSLQLNSSALSQAN